MKQHAIIPKAVLAGTAVFLSTGSGLLAGEPAPYVAPVVPPPDCSGCINPGFYVEGSLLYLNSYASTDGDYDGDWDFGYRGAIGYETPTGLFVELTGFYYEGDFDIDDQFGRLDGEVEHYYIDLVVGDTVHCGELCLAVSGGLRWGGLNADARERVSGATTYRRENEFEGWGPVVKIEGTRALNEQFGIYAELSQSILFGELDERERFDGEGGQDFDFDSDTLAAITEIGAGIEYKFGLGPVSNAFVRLGFEGQYWMVDGSDHGLVGGVLKVGGRF